MEPAIRYPHEYLQATLGHRLGNRMELLAPLGELFSNMLKGVVDQLSAYQERRPFARIKVRGVRVRIGNTRSYVLVDIVDRGCPLRLRQLDEWRIDCDSDYTYDLVHAVNGRRWRFIYRHERSFLEPMVRGIADALVEYYHQRPYAQTNGGLIRFLEEVDRTVLCIEVDDRDEEELDVDGERPTRPELRSRYLVQ